MNLSLEGKDKYLEWGKKLKKDRKNLLNLKC